MTNSFEIGQLTYNINEDSFNGATYSDVAKYCKMVYTNKNRFINRFIKPVKKWLTALDREDRHPSIDMLLYYYDLVTPYSYAEAFKIENVAFKNIVFSAINVSEMIEHLGHERVSVEGKNVTHRKYANDGSYEMYNYDVIYELHKVNCSTLLADNNAPTSLSTDVYAVKCWCTSTNKEHWLWVETEYALKGPLEAIASTVRVYKNMIPYIKEIKRQGDVFLFEMTKEVIPSGEIVALDSKTYFDLLVAQT